MKFKGKIKNLNHIVLSDPSYEKGVWCRYEKDNLNEKDWLVNLDIHTVKEHDDEVEGTEFFLLLKKYKNDCELDDKGTLNYLTNIELKNYIIGVDTACVAFGINDYAKEIINSMDEWQPFCAIRTGADGKFGEVIEGVENNELRFLFITGYFDEEMCNEKELFEYLKNQFEIIDLIREGIILDEDKNNLLEESTIKH